MVSINFNLISFVSEINKYVAEYDLRIISFDDDPIVDDNDDGGENNRMFQIVKDTTSISLLTEAKIEECLTYDMITFDNVLYFTSNCLSIFDHYKSNSNLLSIIHFICKSQCQLYFYLDFDNPQYSDFSLSTLQTYNVSSLDNNNDEEPDG